MTAAEPILDAPPAMGGARRAAPTDARVHVAALGSAPLGDDCSLAIWPGKPRPRPAAGDLAPPATIVDLLYPGDSVRVVGHNAEAGEALVRADPDDAAELAIGQAMPLGFAPDDAVTFGGSR